MMNVNDSSRSQKIVCRGALTRKCKIRALTPIKKDTSAQDSNLSLVRTILSPKIILKHNFSPTVDVVTSFDGVSIPEAKLASSEEDAVENFALRSGGINRNSFPSSEVLAENSLVCLGKSAKSAKNVLIRIRMTDRTGRAPNPSRCKMSTMRIKTIEKIPKKAVVF